MKKSRLTEHQIVAVLNEAETSVPAKDVCRKHGISAPTRYKWKSKYGDLEASDHKRLKEIESELSQYKRMYAVLAQENYALKDVIAKNCAAAEATRSRSGFEGVCVACLWASQPVSFVVVSSTTGPYAPGRTRRRSPHGYLEVHLRRGFLKY